MDMKAGSRILQDPNNPKDTYGIGGNEFDSTYKFDESKQPKRTLIRLTESDLHNIIRESVQKILKETYDPCDELGHLRWRNRDYSNDNKEAQRVGKVRGNALANWHKLVKDSESKVQEEGYDDEYNPHPDDNWHGYGNPTRERWDADEIPYKYKQRAYESKIKRAVEESVNEVMYNGVSYHGTNPYDWVDIADERSQMGWKNRDNVSKYNQARFKAKDQGDLEGAEAASIMADKHRQQWNKNWGAAERNRNNAKQLGWQGQNDTRLGKAQEYYNMSQNAQNPQDRQKYNKMAQDTLGDVEGRANQALNRLRNTNR